MGLSLSESCRNGLSSIPDDLICQILSLLATKDAAVASLSSRRMRAAFMRRTTLDFDDSPISHCADNNPQLIERFQIFKLFVDNVLQASQTIHLSKFTLTFGGDVSIKAHHHYQRPKTCGVHCFPDLESTHVNAWISFPLSCRGVKEIELCFHVRKPDKLPSALFTCETLEVLKLDTNLGFEVISSMPSFSFPNLKELELCSITIPEDDFVTRLVSNCPVLEELYMDCWWVYGKSIIISSPSLKKLTLYVSTESECISNDAICSIDTRNLQYFKYCDYLAMKYSVASMEALVGASFHISDRIITGEESSNSILTLLRAVSNVQRLSLQCVCMTVLCHQDSRNQLPVFHNLTHLKLGEKSEDEWVEVVLELLNCSPVLETLGFPEGIIWDPNPRYIYDGYIEMVESEQEF